MRALRPVRRFFPHFNLSQSTIVSAQNKSQRASHEIFSKLISSFSAFVPLDSESSIIQFFYGPLRVRFAIRTFWHNFPPFRVLCKITIYIMHTFFASKLRVLLAKYMDHLNYSLRFTHSMRRFPFVRDET
jgi:hypothetical protein